MTQKNPTLNSVFCFQDVAVSEITLQNAQMKSVLWGLFFLRCWDGICQSHPKCIGKEGGRAGIAATGCQTTILLTSALSPITGFMGVRFAKSTRSNKTIYMCISWNGGTPKTPFFLILVGWEAQWWVGEVCHLIRVDVVGERIWDGVSSTWIMALLKHVLTFVASNMFGKSQHGAFLVQVDTPGAYWMLGSGWTWICWSN